MSKIICIKYLPSVRPKLIQKIENARDLLKFGSSNISSMPNSILMSRASFMKYLPPARPIFVPKLKMLRMYEIWHIQYFKYTKLYFNFKNTFYEIFTNVMSQLAPKIKMLRIY